nr:unnamed protein product [Callosobruchus analis]
MLVYYYLDVSLEFTAPFQDEITPVFFKKNVIEALRQVFGEVATAVNIDILKLDADARRAIIRVPKTHYVKLRSSLTLARTYEGRICVYKVNKASDLLLSLLGDSRDYFN